MLYSVVIRNGFDFNALNINNINNYSFLWET